MKKLSHCAGQLTCIEKATERLEPEMAPALWQRTNRVHDRVVELSEGTFGAKEVALFDRIQGLRVKIANQLPTSLRPL